jgi:large subunit ribosomal protein L30
MSKIEIKLVRSLSGRPETHRVVVRSLGLRRMNQTVIHPDNEPIRGMVNKISHMLQIRTVEE